MYALNTKSGKGNFYMQPNGVLYWTFDKKAEISTTANFKMESSVQYATQSEPILLLDGKINAKFGQNSSSKHI